MKDPMVKVHFSVLKSLIAGCGKAVSNKSFSDTLSKRDRYRYLMAIAVGLDETTKVGREDTDWQAMSAMFKTLSTIYKYLDLLEKPDDTPDEVVPEGEEHREMDGEQAGRN